MISGGCFFFFFRNRTVAENEPEAIIKQYPPIHLSTFYRLFPFEVTGVLELIPAVCPVHKTTSMLPVHFALHTHKLVIKVAPPYTPKKREPEWVVCNVQTAKLQAFCTLHQGKSVSLS